MLRMFINKKEKFSIRKFKDGRSDSVKIGTVALIVGAALAMAAGTQTVEAAMTENSDNTTTISNDKGSVIVDTANIQNPDAGMQFSTDPTDTGTKEITKTGKVDYKYVTADGNTVLEENKNQDSGDNKTISTDYDVYGKSGEVFKGTTGGDAEASDLNDAKENGKKETIEKDGKTYHLIGEPKVETTGNGGGVYSDTTLGDVTAKLTPEGLSNAEGKITYDTVKPGGKAWIVEQTGKGTYGKYVQADSGAITSDAKMIEAFKAGEATAKNFTSANVTADGGIKEGDYVFVLEKNTYVTAKTESFSLTAQIQLSSSDNVADDKDGTGATLNRTYAMVQNFKAAPDTLTGEANKTLVKSYLAYLQEKGFEDNLLNFKRYITLGIAAKTGGPLEISADKGDQVDDKGRPTSDITADIASVTDQETSTIEDSNDFLLKFSDPSPEVEEYSYRDEITPLRAYRLASGTTTITYTYAEEKTREIEKKGSVVVNYQTEDGTELKAPYTDTPETVAEVVTEKYYVDADGNDVIVSSTTASKNVPYNTKENETEKPQKLTDAQGNVYYLNEANTMTSVNDTETTSPAETGTVVEGVTKVTYIYEKAGSVIVNYKTEDGTPLAGTVVDEDGAGKTVESGAKDTDNGKPGTAYNTADNGMKPTRIKTAEGKVYELVPDLTEGEEEGEVESGTTKEVTYVYKEVKGNVVVKYEDTEGNTLADDEKDETDASLNVKYDTADHKKESIEKDGVKYYLTAKELKDGSKPATGDVVEGTTTVTYVYEKAGSVIVNYQTEDGTPLVGTADGKDIASGAKDTDNGKPGSEYNTADNGMKPTRITTAEGKVYELVPASTKGDETGTVESGQTKEVTYVYKEVKGNVVVHYTDEARNKIAEDAKDTTDGSISTPYDTSDNGMKPERITTPEGKVYELVPASTKGAETGKVTEGTTEVTYVYKEVTGDVIVHYVDTEGNVIAEDKEDTKGASLNAKYDTTDNKPEKIEKDGTVYYLTEKALKDDSKPENGDVVEGKTEVTYVYEKAGQVVVHYTDEKGNTIQADAVDTKDGKPNSDYNTADNGMKPNRITTPEGKVYELIPQSTKGDETGKVKAGETTEVTYVYKEITGNVVVHYVDTEGNTLAEDTKDVENGSLSEKYDTTDNKPAKLEKAGQVYYLTAKELKDGSKPENGAVVEGTTEITYVYEKAGNVLVHYVDEAGNTLQADAVDTKDGQPGAKYDTSDKDMKPTRITTPEGKVYELVPASTKGNETGDVEAGKTTEVTYVYKEVKGNVVVHYTDEAGNTIAEDVKDTTDGSVSSAYDTSDNKPATITTKDGKVYVLVPTSTKGEESGKVTEGTTEVTYVYKEVTGDVVVHYVDTEGNVIAEDKEDTKGASLNAKYDTTDNKPATIEKDGVKYYLTEKAVKDDSKPETGDVVEGKTEVTYVYEKAGQVVVHYVDEAGNTIQTDAVDTKDGKPGVAYNTTDNDMKPTRITTAEGRVYELVPASTKGNENGSVEAGKTTEVTYVYKEVKGNVVVHYVDEAGNTIAEDVKDTTDGSVSSAYDTSDNKPATITTKDGKLYVLVPTSTKGDENGKVTEGTTEVTYVYKEVKEGTTNGGSLTPSQPASPARPSTNPTSPVKPTDPSQPETPVVPTDPSQPTTPANPATPPNPANLANPAGPETPTMPSAPVNGEAPQAQAASSEAKGQAELPNTGTEDNARLAALGLLGVLCGFGLVARKKKED